MVFIVMALSGFLLGIPLVLVRRVSNQPVPLINVLGAFGAHYFVMVTALPHIVPSFTTQAVLALLWALSAALAYLAALFAIDALTGIPQGRLGVVICSAELAVVVALHLVVRFAPLLP